jgi:hypothetical protein
MNKYTKLHVMIVGFSVLIFSCSLLSLPGSEVVKENFLKENPQSIVLSVFVGEGDSEHAYYHIRYKEAKGESIKEVVWLYTLKEDGKWSVDKKLSSEADSFSQP